MFLFWYMCNTGMKNRSVGSHNMNDCSSRSHTMLTVYITSEQQVSHSYNNYGLHVHELNDTWLQCEEFVDFL